MIDRESILYEANKIYSFALLKQEGTIIDTQNKNIISIGEKEYYPDENGLKMNKKAEVKISLTDRPLPIVSTIFNNIYISNDRVSISCREVIIDLNDPNILIYCSYNTNNLRQTYNEMYSWYPDGRITDMHESNELDEKRQTAIKALFQLTLQRVTHLFMENEGSQFEQYLRRRIKASLN